MWFQNGFNRYEKGGMFCFSGWCDACHFDNALKMIVGWLLAAG